MPAATPIPKLAALLVMVTAVALVSREVSAVTANATEAHKSMSARAMLVSRDTDADPKYDMHSLRTGDTTRAEAAEERAPSLKNLRNTVRSWVKRVKMKFRPYSYEQLHPVSINSVNDGLHPGPSVIDSDKADKIFLKRYQAQDRYHPSLIGMTKSPVHLDKSELTEKELQYLKSLFEKEPFFDVAVEDTVFSALATLKKTATEHLWDMYIERDSAIVQHFPGWRKQRKSSVAEDVKSEFSTSDEVAEGYQLKYDTYLHNMAKLPNGRLPKSMDRNSQVQLLIQSQPFPDFARTLFSSGLSKAELKKATDRFNELFYMRYVDTQQIFRWNEYHDLDSSLRYAKYPPLVVPLYKLVYKAYRRMSAEQEAAFAKDEITKVIIPFQKFGDTVNRLEFEAISRKLKASERTALAKAKTEREKLAPQIMKIAKLENDP